MKNKEKIILTKRIKNKYPLLYNNIIKSKDENKVSNVKNGDAIKLNVKLILADKQRKNIKFINFVKTSRNKIYHARILENLNIVDMNDNILIGIEESDFIFLYTEIIKV